MASVEWGLWVTAPINLDPVRRLLKNNLMLRSWLGWAAANTSWLPNVEDVATRGLKAPLSGAMWELLPVGPIQSLMEDCHLSAATWITFLLTLAVCCKCPAVRLVVESLHLRGIMALRRTEGLLPLSASSLHKRKWDKI